MDFRMPEHSCGYLYARALADWPLAIAVAVAKVKSSELERLARRN